MSVTQTMIDRLEQNGRFSERVREIMEKDKASKELASMADHWEQPAQCYPKGMEAGIWLSVKKIALEWIDEKLPQAFYRPMFE